MEKQQNSQMVNRFTLHQCYPNPFNPVTTILFELSETAEVSLTIVNLQGQAVRHLENGVLRSGEHRVQWNARDDQGNFMPSGVYFYCLKSGDFVDQKKMILAR